VSAEKPSQVTDAYWVYAHGPGRAETDTRRRGKWLLFVQNERIDEWWARVKAATEQGTLGASRLRRPRPGGTRWKRRPKPS
jgi:hypothetical protein